MPIYTYHGNFKPNIYYNFSFQIKADSTEDANAKAEEYFRNEANHESIVKNSEVDDIENDIRYLKYYFQENAEIDFASRESLTDQGDEDIEISMYIKP
jgi:hypothetical protein